MSVRTFALGMAVAVPLSFNASAQKVDLDKFNFEIEYLNLPTHYLPAGQRTYTTDVQLSPMSESVINEGDAERRIGIDNFTRQDEGGTVRIDVQLGNTVFNRSEIKTRTDQTKDKSGKVTSTKYYYSVYAWYNSEGRYAITGPKNPYKALPKKKKKDEAQTPSENPFLKDAGDVETAGNSQTVKFNAGGSRSYTSPESSSSYEASRLFRINGEEIMQRLHNDFVNETLRQVSGRVNDMYGYVPVKETYFLWILDSKNHPEYQMQQNAIQAVKELLGRVKAESSTDALETALKPVMAYFESLKTKYTGDDKRERKLRYSAYFNLAKLYLVLDYPDKAIEQAQGLIKNDYDTGDGEDLMEKAEELKSQLQFHHIGTRHLGGKS